MIGPLQLLVFGFEEDKKARDIIRVAKSLKRAKAIRLFDLVYVIKDQEGKIQAKEVSELRTEEKREFGALAKALLGLAAQDVESMDAQGLVDSLKVADEEFGLSDSDLQEVAAQVPNGTSAIFVIFEHVWARDVKEALQKAGGQVRASGMINPTTLETSRDALDTVLEAINRAEASAMDELVDVKVGAEADAETARVESAEAISVAQAEAEAARLEAIEAVAEAQAREDLAAIALAAAEQREVEATQSVADAQAREQAALEQAAQAATKAQELEDQAFAEAETVRRAAERQKERAMAEAAEVERQAQEIEATAVLRAMDALVNARIIEGQAARHALETIIAANVLEAAAVQDAAKMLTGE
jgi:uncharacterized membrane protein